MTMQVTTEKLIRDVRLLLREADELIRTTSGEVSERAREARARLSGAVSVTRETCDRLDRILNATPPPRPQPRPDHLYETIGLAGGFGLLLGLLLSRR